MVAKILEHYRVLGPFKRAQKVPWFLRPLERGDTSNSQGFLIWSEVPAFGLGAQHWVRILTGSGPWLVRLGCRGEGGVIVIMQY